MGATWHPPRRQRQFDKFHPRPWPAATSKWETMARCSREASWFHSMLHWVFDRRERYCIRLECFYRYIVYITFLQICYHLNPINSMWHCYSTGASVIACQRTNRYLIALERDEEIFEAVLKPYVDQARSNTNPSSSSNPTANGEPRKKKARRYMGGWSLKVLLSFISNSYFLQRFNLTLVFSYAGLKQRLFLHSDVIQSPPNSFVLPMYAESLAEQWVDAPSPICVEGHRSRIPRGVLRFIDFEADQCDEDFDAPETDDISFDWVFI